jgi:hypothetical protein
VRLVDNATLESPTPVTSARSNGKAGVIFRDDTRIEEIGIEPATLRCGFVVPIEVEPPRDQNGFI